uniref:hypothetical protein n=1 Tax=Eisenbergiella sp. TaxID=1924109 RepID=UPI003AB7837A
MRKKQHGMAVKITAYILSAAMVLGSGISASAAVPNTQKDENVYANLNQDGSVDGIYVVNAYLLDKETDIVDYGKYDSVKNLTTDAEINKKGDTITTAAPEGKFFYQGNLKTKELPWEISIHYYLDGKEMDADELAGQNGSLKITIHIGKNDQVEEAFFENYLLQATVTMDMDKCSRLQAAGATVGNVGASKQLVYNIMAGQEKDIVITADVLDFTMDPISFQGVPMSFDLDRDSLSMDSLTEKTGDIKDAADEFSDGAAELYDGAGALKDGASDLHDGANSLKEGIESYSDGAHSLGEGIDTLKDGTDDLSDGATQLSDGISSLKEGVDKLAGGYSGDEGAAAGAKKLAEGADKLKSGAGQLSEGISTFVGMIGSMGDTTELDSQGQMLIDKLLPFMIKINPDYQLKEGTVEEQIKQLSGDMDKMVEDLLKRLEAMGSPDNTEKESKVPQSGVSENTVLKEENPEAESAGETEETAEETEAGENGGMQESQETQETQESQENENSTVTESAESQKETQTSEEQTGTGSAEAVSEEEVQKQSETEKPKVTEKLQETTISGGGQREETIEDIKYEKRYSAYSLVSLNYRNGYPLRNTGNVIRTASYTDNLSSQSITEIISDLLKARLGMAQLLGAYQVMDTLNEKLNNPATKEQLGQLTAGSSALADGVAALADGAKALSDGIGQLADGTSQLQSGVTELNDGGKELADGTRDLADGVSGLADGAKELTDAADDLKDGTSQLADGTGDFLTGTQDLADGVKDLKEGTDEFKDKTSDIDTQIDDEIDKVVNDFAGSDFTPLSFVSDKNTNIGLVQFVMKTEGIKLPEKEKAETVEEPLTFWQRLVKLFKK